MRTVIAYDVADDPRREKVSALLEDYGQRVNYSVFECELDAAALRDLQAQLADLIEPRTDRIAFYPICAACRSRCTFIGTPIGHASDETVVML